MIRHPPRTTRTEKLLPNTTLVRSSRLVTGARPPWPVLQQARPAALCGARLQCRVDPRARPGVAPPRPRALLRRDQELRPGGGRLRPGTAPRAGLRAHPCRAGALERAARSEEHTSELQSLMRRSYAVFCLKTKTTCTEQHETEYK